MLTFVIAIEALTSAAITKEESKVEDEVKKEEIEEINNTVSLGSSVNLILNNKIKFSEFSERSVKSHKSNKSGVESENSEPEETNGGHDILEPQQLTEDEVSPLQQYHSTFKIEEIRDSIIPLHS